LCVRVSQPLGAAHSAAYRHQRAVDRLRSSAAESVASAEVFKRTRERLAEADRLDPLETMWYKCYVCDPRGWYADSTSRHGRLFRRRFRLNWDSFKDVLADANQHADFCRWHDGTVDALKRPCSPLVRTNEATICSFCAHYTQISLTSHLHRGIPSVFLWFVVTYLDTVASYFGRSSSSRARWRL
jgi:hypothetical protein